MIGVSRVLFNAFHVDRYETSMQVARSSVTSHKGNIV